MSTIYIMIAIALYLGVLIILGARYAKGNNTVEDYYLGGRKLGPYVAAMSAEASDMSSWLLMGLPGVAYLSGMCDAFWTALGLGIGTYLNWLLEAKRLRYYTEIVDADTVPDFFEKRFKDKSHLLMGISAIVIVVFFVPYTASGFAAFGKLFASLFGINYVVAMLISAVIIIAYTAMGGFMAASTTDFVQSIVMTVALIAVVCFGVSQCGGVSAVSAFAGSLDGYVSIFATNDYAGGTAQPYGFLTIISTMAWGLGYFGMPHILLRFMAIEDPDKIRLSRRIATVWVFIAMGVAIFIGIMARAMAHYGVFGELEDSERAAIVISPKLAENGADSPTLAKRLNELEKEKRTVEKQLFKEEQSITPLDKAQVIYFLERFTEGDIDDFDYRRRITDILVNKVWVYDKPDGDTELEIAFNLTNEPKRKINLSDVKSALKSSYIGRCVPPQSSCTNHFCLLIRQKVVVVSIKIPSRV